MKRRKSPLVSVWPDDCECSARDRCTCQQACKPVRHKIRCAIVSRKGACDCGALPPVKGLLPLPWPPFGVNVTRWTAKRVYGGALQDQVNQLAAIRNAVYHHPHDFHIGMVVYWMRDRVIRAGTVIEVTGNDYQPAVVRSAGHPRRYKLKPTIYAYCDAEGRKPCVCDLPVGKRTACQQQKHCPIRSGDAKPEEFGERVVGRWSGRKLGDDPAALGMTLHDAKVIPGLMIQGSLMGPNEYAARPFSHEVADYEVRNGGIYTRRFNVRLAKFALNSTSLQDVLKKIFDTAHADKQAKIEAFKISKLPVEKQIKLRQAAERKRFRGWYTCQCGQWVHDKDAPCSVCKPKRKLRKKK